MKNKISNQLLEKMSGWKHEAMASDKWCFGQRYDDDYDKLKCGCIARLVYANDCIWNLCPKHLREEQRLIEIWNSGHEERKRIWETEHKEEILALEMKKQMEKLNINSF